MKTYLGVDLGGTNIAVGVVTEDYEIIGRGKLPTKAPRDPGAIMDDIRRACALALDDAGLTFSDVEWVGVGCPGIINRQKDAIILSNNLDFHNTPVLRLLKKRFPEKVFLEGDLNCAAFGEVLCGGAKGYRDVVLVTIGTGIGGSIILDGKIRGMEHVGIEPGHIGMAYDGLPCGCGRRGCIEMYCSATALIRQTREQMERYPESVMWRLCGGDPAKATGRTSFDGMRAGDPAAAEVVRQYCDYLGYAVTTYISMLQPELVLIGGGLCKEGDTLLEPVRKYCRTHSLIGDKAKEADIKAATLGNDAGIIGAAFLGTL
ncbi:ROK family protein [Harryflintia acetispora]|uniref:Glucokinase n=1 Tax=Harryflintia acetispora TaxID=1849041 RepID=A0A9X8Y8Z3_9FIRM|nr:ROK family protein [Harryflintia acetispora]TCL44654.1 glucokinase [Harryflintia acetispora]